MSEAIGDRPRVLVTGASRRIGQEVALQLAERGCDLVLTTSRGLEALDGTIGALQARVGGACRVERVSLDLAESRSVERAAEAIGRTPLDGIVHNASVYEACPLERTAEPRLLRDFSIHAAGPLRLTAALRPALEASKHRGGAGVVFSLDIHAPSRPRKGWASYLLSKSAASALVEILAIELSPSIRVGGVAFGAVLWPEGADPAEVAAYEARTPLGRSGTPQEAAQSIVYLLLDASFASGGVLRLDGGRALR